MSTVIITGSGGLIGSEAALFYGKAGYNVVSIDNDMRRYFFGQQASTGWNRERVAKQIGHQYQHYAVDIRDRESINEIFARYQSDLTIIIHTAAQPSHDWAAKEPFTDFTINANGTLVLLEATRQFCPEAVFVHFSTNKVYGDRPNSLPLVELETRWEIDANHSYQNGIPEEMSIDQSMHSLFGASKAAGDLLVQEYGHYFNIKSAVFRGGVLSGPQHSGAQLHGFPSYLMRCAITDTPYTIIGYKGKQVRDIIHCSDVISAIDAFVQAPRIAEVYNLGGGRESNISVLEGIQTCEEITGQKMKISYTDTHRMGDHIWYISDLRRFKFHYPNWKLSYSSVREIFQEIYDFNKIRWTT